MQTPVKPSEHARFSFLVAAPLSAVFLVGPSALAVISAPTPGNWTALGLMVAAWLMTCGFIAWVHYEVARHDPAGHRLLLYVTYFLEEAQKGMALPPALSDALQAALTQAQALLATANIEEPVKVSPSQDVSPSA